MCMTLFAMLLIYIQTLHRRMRTFNFENVKLLDGMHEGLLILQKPPASMNSMRLANEIMFCNRSAEKLLTNLINFWSAKSQKNEKADDKAVIEAKASQSQAVSRIVQLKLFQPVKITVQNHV